MELFLLVSMALTIVTFFLIVVSEPAAPSLAEHDSDYSTEYIPDFVPQESAVEMRVPTASKNSDTNITLSQTIQQLKLSL